MKQKYGSIATSKDDSDADASDPALGEGSDDGATPEKAKKTTTKPLRRSPTKKSSKKRKLEESEEDEVASSPPIDAKVRIAIGRGAAKLIIDRVELVDCLTPRDRKLADGMVQGLSAGYHTSCVHIQQQQQR